MLDCFIATPSKSAVPIVPVTEDQYVAWLKKQDARIKQWAQAMHYQPKPEAFCLIPDAKGRLAQVLLSIKDERDFWAVGTLPTRLPAGCYHLAVKWPANQMQRALMAWGLGSYQFSVYKKTEPLLAQLSLPKDCDGDWVDNVVTSIYWVRDLINTPTNDMGPAELGSIIVKEGKALGAHVEQIIGDDLLKRNYPSIHTVGRGSANAPRLIDLRWGDTKHPKLTLVGKGVCFDSGGLDLKTADGMADMKKDMGGAAHAIGLARMVMRAKLPVNLRVLIPAVENCVSGDAYHPGDIIKTRSGLTVEVINTDAEGRIVLSDALTEAASEKPDLLIDFATLTGAARVALGTEIAGLFSNHDALALDLMRHAETEDDPTWRLPAYQPYRKQLDSQIADIRNVGKSRYGGAITAKLFLQAFVPDEVPWAHFDIMAANVKERPGRPEGGGAHGLRAVFAYLLERYRSHD